MQVLHYISVEYKGATNTRGSRVIIKSLYHDNDKLTIGYDYSKNSIYDMAIDHLNSKGVDIITRGTSGDGYILGTLNFNKLNEVK